MSLARCDMCERVVDTDEDVEGIFPAVSKRNWQAPPGMYPDYVCWSCVQETPDQTVKSWGYDPETGEEL